MFTTISRLTRSTLCGRDSRGVGERTEGEGRVQGDGEGAQEGVGTTQVLLQGSHQQVLKGVGHLTDCWPHHRQLVVDNDATAAANRVSKDLSVAIVYVLEVFAFVI